MRQKGGGRDKNDRRRELKGWKAEIGTVMGKVRSEGMKWKAGEAGLQRGGDGWAEVAKARRGRLAGGAWWMGGACL
ncbi:hypothetical protein E2C01_067737 [Portunus trituberculatus]|uniref:Uncharacterized protein n=1 Tax=Portunus trituberculatus TaxID=210409 RepID=A0A5B7HUH0_PORTR|nr:hypothetical protein [Portunus trituberculatus]